MAMLNGQAFWSKIIGPPVQGKFDKGRAWTFDVAINEDTVTKLQAEGAGPYIREPKDSKDHKGSKFIQFKRNEEKFDGSASKPFDIVDHKGQPWSGELIGNGSIINVKYLLNQVETGKNKGAMKPACLKIQVVKHEPYGDNEDFPTYDEDGQEEEWN